MIDLIFSPDPHHVSRVAVLALVYKQVLCFFGPRVQPIESKGADETRGVHGTPAVAETTGGTGAGATAGAAMARRL